MKKLKLNKKLLFAGLGTVLTASLVSVAAVACNNEPKSGETKDGFISNTDKNVYYTKPTSGDNSGYVAGYKKLTDEGAKYIGAISFSNSNPLAEALKANKLENNAVAALIDDRYTGDAGKDRVASVSFRTDHGGFLAGISAAYYLNANQDKFKSDEGKLKWGAFVGMSFASTTTFAQGFKFGMMWANDKLKNMEIKQEGSDVKKTWINVEQVTESDFISGNFDANSGTAKTIVDTMISNKANIILPIAGPQTSIATKALKDSNSKSFVIGVDSVQEDDNSVNVSRTTNTDLTGGKTLLFSIIKRVDLALNATLNAAVEGASLTADIKKDSFKLGTHTTVSLDDSSKHNDEYLVGISDAGKSFLVEAVKLVDPNATEYNKVIKSLKTDELFTLLNEDKSQTYSQYLSAAAKTDKHQYTVKDEFKTKTPIELQKLLGGTAYVHGDKVYVYTLDESSYLDSSASRSNSKALKDAWENADDAKKSTLAKIILGQPDAVLKDGSFSQSAYEGLKSFYKSKKIILPNL